MHKPSATWAIVAATAVLGTSSLLAATLRGPSADTSQKDLESIDTFVADEMQKHHVPGVSIAIVHNGRAIISKGYGLANVELAVPATEHTVYQLASVSKQFTACAVVMLAKDGKLSLDDKISKHLPNLPAAWQSVTIRQLLNHTSGIKNYTSVPDFFKLARNDYEHQRILELVANGPLEFAPGEKWSYSNTGYFLLGMIIEKAGGKTYGDFLAERIFKPLEMTHTRFNDLRAIISNRAQGYTWDGKTLLNGDYVSPTQPFAAGALVSTVSDMVKWDAALSNEKLLEKRTAESMWTPAILKNGESAEYGLGWGISKVNGHRLVFHGGGIPGFSTSIFRFLDDRLTVIVFANADNANADSLTRGIAKRILPVLTTKAVDPIADTDVSTTNRLKAVLMEATKGNADPSLFTETAKKLLVPRLKSDGKAMFAPFGNLKTFQLLERRQATRAPGHDIARLSRILRSARFSVSTRPAKSQASRSDPKTDPPHA